MFSLVSLDDFPISGAATDNQMHYTFESTLLTTKKNPVSNQSLDVFKHFEAEFFSVTSSN